jgi:hypothetical protein
MRVTAILLSVLICLSSIGLAGCGIDGDISAALKHNNIFESGVFGILDDIREKVDLPRDLYVSPDNGFELKFDADGTILSIDAFLSGVDEEENKQSFLINYDAAKSAKIKIHLQSGGFSSAESRNLSPLEDIVSRLSLEQCIAQWVDNGQEEFGIKYFGMRQWSGIEEGLFFIDPRGQTEALDSDVPFHNALVNYTVSVYLPNVAEGEPFDFGKADSVVYYPQRYIAVDDFSLIDETLEKAAAIYALDNPSEKPQLTVGTSETLENGTVQFFLTPQIAYCLTVLDAATGSRYYTFAKTTNGGSWFEINKNPYSDAWGVASGMFFADENIGFIGLTHGGGTYGELFRTADGGVTFEQIAFPEDVVLPGIPYLRDDNLYVEIGKGYEGTEKFIYKSTDGGVSWTEDARSVR